MGSFIGTLVNHLVQTSSQSKTSTECRSCFLDCILSSQKLIFVCASMCACTVYWLRAWSFITSTKKNNMQLYRSLPAHAQIEQR